MRLLGSKDLPNGTQPGKREEEGEVMDVQSPEGWKGKGTF